ncbi:MAG: hypothetical protein JNL70_21600 [Saprospiraceae bacterium]|nr:hypothetical protein [Saprospiraceae bacterium]
MENYKIFGFATTKYEISEVTYDYTDDYDDLYLSAVTILPMELFPYPLTVTLALQDCLKNIEKHDADMVKYVRKMIESYEDQSFWDKLAFDALENEGFDLKQFMRLALSEIELRITKQIDPASLN